MLWFFVGLFVGSFLGIIIYCSLIVAKEADRTIEEQNQKNRRK